MRWVKQGCIFRVDGQLPWMVSHAAVPLPRLLDDARLRIYFGPRDAEGRTRIAFLDVDAVDPTRVLELHDRPALDLGRLGTFDDSGAMPGSLVSVGDDLYLFYIGWNRGVSVPYRNAIGLAVSTDGGVSFSRVHDGPVVDRNAREPYFTTTPYVMLENGTWRMWYASATGWTTVDGRPEPVYVIKYAESADAVTWRRDDVTCIVPRSPDEASTRPWVVRDSDTYRMWYCFRGIRGYRHNRQSYRIGYAESSDGVSWTRKDEHAGIAVSDNGWDCEMVAYPSVYQYRGTSHLLYNGNGFGTTGMGHAVADSSI